MHIVYVAFYSEDMSIQVSLTPEFSVFSVVYLSFVICITGFIASVLSFIYVLCCSYRLSHSRILMFI